MKCPLRVIAIPQEICDKVPAATDCLKEECAWWSPMLERCALQSQTSYLRDIALAIEAIAEKIPYKGQFTK